MSTLRISNIEAKSVPASATVDEKVKITNSSGDTLVFIDGKTSGITTVGINTTDSNITFDANSNVVVTGIITATRFSGEITPTTLNVSGGVGIGDSIFHIGDDNTQIRFPAADTITFETGGSERFRIVDAASTFTNKLIIDDGSNGHLFLNNTSTDNTIHSGTTGFAAYKNIVINAAQHIFKISNTEKFRIKSNGQIVLGSDGTNSELTFTQDGTSGTQLNATTTGSGGYNTLSINSATFIHKYGSNERLRIDSSGRSLFKTTGSQSSPVADNNIPVQIAESSASMCYFGANKGNSYGSLFGHHTAYGGTVIRNVQSDDIVFYTNNSAEKVRMKSTGDLQVLDGNLVVANGRGIDFSATGNSTGSMGSELFKDYEEGTFTPIIRTNNNSTEPSYHHRVGQYTRIGNLVTYVVRITTSGELSTGSGATEIWGLPFAASNWTTGDWPGGADIAYYNNLRGAYGTHPRLLGPYRNSTYVRFHIFNNQNDTSNNQYNHIFTNNTIIIAYGQYYTG